MTGKCINISGTFNKDLTCGKEYEIIKIYDDPSSYIKMVMIFCDTGLVMSFRADRFIIK